MHGLIGGRQETQVCRNYHALLRGAEADLHSASGYRMYNIFSVNLLFPGNLLIEAARWSGIVWRGSGVIIYLHLAGLMQRRTEVGASR